MGKVSVATTNFQAEGSKFERAPENVMLEVADAYYKRIEKDAGLTGAGKVIPARSYTAAILEVTAPKSEDPNKVFHMELGAGKFLVPSEDGTFLDDAHCTKDSERKLHQRCGWAVFLTSLAAAGADTGIYGASQEAAVTDNIKALIGMQFHHGKADMNGGDDIGIYKASIATTIYAFKQGSDADMEKIGTEIVNVLAKAPLIGYAPAELAGKLNVTHAQLAMVNELLSNKEWVKANTGHLFKLTQTGRFIKA
jgi:hypothetical protein